MHMMKVSFIILLKLTFIFCAIYMICEVSQFGTVGRPVICDQQQKSVVRKFITANATLLSLGSVCHTPRCFSLYESALSNFRIPKIRHILWKSDKLSKYMANQLSTWKSIHPDWMYVLWQDSDLEKFVAKYYTCVLARFKSVREHIMRVDWIRYMILHHFGGVYADLDYQLILPLDKFLRFPAVVTRDTEVHALMYFGMDHFPPPVFGNPACMMSTPGHPFFLYSTVSVTTRPDDDVFKFAGPLALSDLLKQYAKEFPISENPEGVVIVPPSRNFYGFGDNSLWSSTPGIGSQKVNQMRKMCKEYRKKHSQSKSKILIEYCKDVANLDPITDRRQLVYAIHDINKTKSSYNHGGSSFFENDLIDIRKVLPTVVMADTLF